MTGFKGRKIMIKKERENNHMHMPEAALDEKTLWKDPFKQFSIWWDEVLKSGIADPDAMFLATVGKDNRPSGRIVLLKGFDRNGFIFFTNLQSRKGREINENAYVALTFYWKEVNKQVRILGKATRVRKSEADKYFESRSVESRISAWISPQSEVIPGREFLELKWKEFLSRSGSGKISRPPFWGGYRIKPSIIEFWQKREHRLHDRICYRFSKGKWVIERLSP